MSDACVVGAPVQQDVPVTAFARRETGMEALRHHPGPGHRDITRQVARRAVHPGMVAALSRGVEVHDLAAGVNTGVGTPGGDHADRFVGDPRQGSLQFTLDRGDTILQLPAAVARPVVLHPERDPHGGDSGPAPGKNDQ